MVCFLYDYFGVYFMVEFYVCEERMGRWRRNGFCFWSFLG